MTRSDSTNNMPQKIQSDLTTRTYSLDLKTLDEKTRSVEAVIATENRVKVIDWERYEVVEEILLMDGCELPESRQVPMLDTHDRSTVQKQIGSTRDLRIENGKLIGRNVYGSSPQCSHAWDLVREGHLKDNSIGYRVLNSVTIEPGKSATINNRQFTASPTMALRVVTQWQVKENSNCPIGADSDAKMRQEDRPKAGQNTNQRKDQKMDEFKKWLQARGLDYDKLEEASRTALKADFDAENARKEPAKQSDGNEGNRTESDTDPLKIAAEAARNAVEAERKRAAEIRKIGRECGIDNEVVERCVAEGKTLDETRAEFLTALRGTRSNPVSQAPYGIVIDKTINRNVLSDALLMRGGFENIILKDKSNGEKRIDAAKQVRDISLMDVCRHALMLDGQSVPSSREELIQRAFSTVSLSTILGAVYEKSVMQGYEALETTWERWCNVGTASDFKAFTRVRISGDGSMEKVTPSGEIAIGSHGEEKELATLDTYGKRDTFSRKDIINDDLQLLTKTPLRRGMDAARLINDLVYEELMSNPTMDDNITLFHATSHANLMTSSALSEGNLQSAITKFRQQKGKNKKPVRVVPRFLIVPPELEWTARKLLESINIYIKGSTDGTAPSANVLNGLLSYIVEESLSNSAFTNYSATTWYLAGNGANNEADTVEVSFLNGNRNPTIRTFNNIPGVLGIQFEAFIDVVAKALDYRALLKATA